VAARRPHHPGGAGFPGPEAYAPASPWELPAWGQPLTTDARHPDRGDHLRVGDFDVDGQTSTALLVSVLRSLGGVVSYHIPVRSVESHGINLPVLRELIAGASGVAELPIQASARWRKWHTPGNMA